MNKEKLYFWQEKLSECEAAYSSQSEQMDGREELYLGSDLIRGGRRRRTPHVRNICAELIEAQVDANIPQPKVSAKRKCDEGKAKLIEDMIRGELDRLPMEQINDIMERTVPIQGGCGLAVEWDSQSGDGDVSVSCLHPKYIVPQAGVWSSIADMDYIFLKIPQTGESVLREFGVSIDCDNIVQNIVYYKNGEGGIGKFSWADDVVLCDLFDYQARCVKVCDSCGGVYPIGYEVCPECSGELYESERGTEVLECDVVRSDGSIIPKGSVLPFYKPGVYPVILQKNVSVFGRFLGDSDIDKIRDQQNTINRIEAKIIDKLCKSGSYITLPDDASIRADEEDMKVIRPGSAASKAMIDVYDLQGDISQDLAYMQSVYEEARQIIGITDSYQGRADSTATSGKAKEFAAAQSAGRLESKRVMKNAAYASLFEAIFKMRLAYADTERCVVSEDGCGNKLYCSFNRYDFIEQNESGEWVWNDDFTFSCDVTAPLASNREAMWEETRKNLQSGAFGDPACKDTLILFWSKMEMLHYPGAAQTKRYLEGR